MKRKRKTTPAPPEESSSSSPTKDETAPTRPTTMPKPKTTRVCIKNLPPSFDEEKLKGHLLRSGGRGGGGGGTGTERKALDLVVTDCKVLKTKDGKSRKLGFVGFKTPEMASHVVHHFHNTFAQTSKLYVELAFSKKTGPPSEYRPWSKHSEGSSRHEKERQRQGKGARTMTTNTDEGKGNDPTDGTKRESRTDDQQQREEESDEVRQKKQEFLAAMGLPPAGKSGEGGPKSKFWANDDAVVVSREEVAKKGRAGRHDESSTSDSDSSSDNDETDADSIDSGGEGAHAILQAKRIQEKKSSVNADMSDMDFLRSKVTDAENLTDDDDDAESKQTSDGDAEQDGNSSVSSSSVPSSSNSSDEEGDDAENDGADSAKSVRQSAATDGDVAPDRLFVRNLPFASTEDELRDLFGSYGEITECHIPVDDAKRNKGYAFVRFESSSAAAKAMGDLDGTDFQGRLIHILPARRGHNEEEGRGAVDSVGAEGKELTYKEKQELARQKEAQKSATGWSASFVRGDAVVDNLSDRLGLAKGEILNVKDGLSSGSAAVRLALGETHIIEENRAYFANHGVDMDALVSSGSVDKKRGDSKAVKRSATMILVKNLPYDTTHEGLTKVFHGVGGDIPQRILLPPSRTIALVEYGHPIDARRVFRKLAYKRFKNVPLYLEWAPLCAKKEKHAPAETRRISGEENAGVNDIATSESAALKDSEDEKQDADHPPEPGLSHTIYVKNLNFLTSESHLKSVFEKVVGRVRAVKIPTKSAPIKRSQGRQVSGDVSDTRQLSMGFGFVECETDEAARKAIKAMQGRTLDGHALILKLSSKAIAPPDKAARIQSTGRKNTKLMVRNVPFEATRKELLQLFGSFGHLKKVRLPKKFDGTHRGFAFVEFLTGQEAQNAMSALSRTHLYGRHLVLEWADDKDDIDSLRNKAKRDVLEDTSTTRKNKKKRFD